jgi:hypothetical protein
MGYGQRAVTTRRHLSLFLFSLHVLLFNFYPVSGPPTIFPSPFFHCASNVNPHFANDSPLLFESAFCARGRRT